MKLYFVKRDLWGIPRGRVERFADNKAGPLVLDGSIEPYDPRQHAGKPGAPDRVAAKGR